MLGLLFTTLFYYTSSYYMMRSNNKYIVSNLLKCRNYKICKPKSLYIKNLRSSASNDFEIMNDSNEILSKYMDEIIKLRGTPELVDRLENLASKYPGLELNMDLYRSLYSFKLDTFQENGLQELMSGNNVLVTTPTGSGKTLVGELAIYFALMMGLRVAYTTPLKALSNQKFKDFKDRYGADRVGLLTGDIAINRGAPITIMTTEVFRNMIYDHDSRNQLSNLFMVCFDEFHFMNDPDRGTVWEESVISCPPSVRILALSATMGNVADIQGWISSIHGPTSLVASDYRPVPLRYFFAMKQGLFPLFRNPNAGPGAIAGVMKDNTGKLDIGMNINPTIMKYEEQFLKASSSAAFISRGGRPNKLSKPNPNHIIAKYSDVAEELNNLQQLPAIVFIFSRAGCEQSAKLVMQTKRKLLTVDDIQYINNALARFIQTNPDIPVAKESIAMLRAGVGVHHAGLITVWKAFIEDLFNANKIKILFATETLAAGVNMPARTTVITSVTKRINSEVIKLKTSQLLQMAGRAGRRGKDTEGSVVIMRNRFEDVKMGHKILTSPTDGIKSHFKTSYSLTVTLLETRSIEECRALIERGFGAYLMQQRIQKKIVKSESSEVDIYRAILQKYSLKSAREYLKIARKLDKESKNLEFLLDKMMESETELVQAIADYMPIGIGILLRNGDSGFFLGDVKWGTNNMYKGLGVLTRDLNLFVVNKEHIRTFSEATDCIPSNIAQSLLDLVTIATKWDEMVISGCKKPFMKGTYTITKEVNHNEKLINALTIVSKAPSFPLQSIPGSITRQQMIVEELKKEYIDHPIVLAKEEEAVLQALKYAAKLKDPQDFVKTPMNNFINNNINKERPEGDVFAWKMFQNVFALLQNFDALNGTEATELGQMVGSLSTDNELWLALVLQHPSVQSLNEAELAGLMCGIVIDGYKSSNAYFMHKPSETIKDVFVALEPLYWELKSEQGAAGVDFPVYLGVDASGLVESWINGTSWRDLCKETSLDQGDVCRMLRRTVEVLRQIPNCYGAPPRISQLAFDAAMKMDRFPVADIDPTVTDIDPTMIQSTSSGDRDTAGVGFEFAGSTTTSSSSLDNNPNILDILNEQIDEDELFDELGLDELLDSIDIGDDDDDDDRLLVESSSSDDDENEYSDEDEITSDSDDSDIK